jgi:hypothetical protein
MHSALGKSPFEVLYGHTPHQFRLSTADACLRKDLELWLAGHNLMVRLLKQQLERVQACMKAQADKNRSV